MIVDSMTLEEVFELYRKDLPFVNNRIKEYSKIIDKRIKYFSLHKERYYFEPMSFSTRNGFDFVIQFYKSSSNEVDVLGKSSYIQYATFVKNKGRFAINHTIINKSIIQTQIYIPHFFDRYRERYLKDKSIKMSDVIYKYIMNNLKSVDMKKEVPSEKYPNEYWKACHDGLCLCEKLDINFTINKTFVSWEMAKKDQKDFAVAGKNFIEDLGFEIDLPIEDFEEFEPEKGNSK